MTSLGDVLTRLGQLHTDGFLSDEEFTAQKELLLAASVNGDLTDRELGVAAAEITKLEQLAGLVGTKVLTPEEFTTQKRRILRSATNTKPAADSRTARTQSTGLADLAQSRVAMSLFAAAALLVVVSEVLWGIGWCTYTYGSNQLLSNLIRASHWVECAVFPVALIAVVTVLIASMFRLRLRSAVDLIGILIAVILASIGDLMNAVTDGASSAAPIVYATGFGVLSVFLLVSGAVRVIAQHDDQQLAQRAWPFFVVSLAALTYAVGAGLASVNFPVNNVALLVASASITAGGYFILALVAGLLKVRHVTHTALTALVVTGLSFVVLSLIGSAVADGLVYSGHTMTLLEVRLEFAIPAFGTAFAWVWLMIAAFARILEIRRV